MTTEQKAKAYDEALKWMRDLYPNMGIAAKEKAESIFPELCESKDERIRKTLINFFQDWHKNRSHCWGISVPEILAWLEKQGRQKSSDAKRSNDDEKEVTILKTYIRSKDWSERHVDRALGIVDELVNKVKFLSPQPKQEWSEEDDYNVQCLIAKVVSDIQSGNVGRNHELIDWLESIKNRVIPQSKQEWSEEDEAGLGDAMWAIEQARTIAKDENDMGNLWCAERWLKSLKDRVYPKHEWKQENTDNLTDFENAMMHIGESFFGNNAGLDPNDTNAIKEQANTLLGLVPSKEWSEEDEAYMCDVIAFLEDARDCRQNALDCINWVKSIKERIGGKL